MAKLRHDLADHEDFFLGTVVLLYTFTLPSMYTLLQAFWGANILLWNRYVGQ